MNRFQYLFFAFLLAGFFCQAQESAKYLPEKPGKWTYSSNIKIPGAEVAAFNKNLAATAEWFHQHVPLLASPKGFDLLTTAFGSWDDHYKKNSCNYGMRAEMNFDFQLFLSNGGQWKVEPPHWSFEINNTETGHGTNSNFHGWDNTKDPEALQPAMDKAVTALNGLFRIFPLVREIAPGVSLFGDGNLIVFNPDRPPFWIPVTVREVAEIKLAYYKNKDVDLLPYLKQEIAKLTEEELNAPAYSGNDEYFVLDVHPEYDNKTNENGGQIMRFNPEYWDRSLPPSAIQFMTFYYPERSQAETDEFFTNNGHPIFGDVIMNSLKLEDLAGLIASKK